MQLLAAEGQSLSPLHMRLQVGCSCCGGRLHVYMGSTSETWVINKKAHEIRIEKGMLGEVGERHQ